MKKFIFLLLVISVTLLSLYSCAENGVEQGTEDNVNKDNSATEYTDLVVAAELDANLLEALRYNIEVRCKDSFRLQAEHQADATAEIIIGRTESELSRLAYRKLGRLEKEDMEVGFVIYSDGTSTAIAYDEDQFDSICGESVAIAEFIAALPDDGLELKKGLVASGVTNVIDWQFEIDTVKRNEEWELLATLIGTERGEKIVAAAKDYYSIFSSDLILWLANLYEPEAGAFYYSNSGRDTIGYGPDIETTQQALDFLSTSGVFDSIYDIPDWMKEPLLKWLKPLQDPNGYFYHPQWSKEDVDAQLSRRGRDLDRAVYLLNVCGSSPTYDTITGAKGDHTLIDGTKVDSSGSPLAPVSKLSAPLGTARAIAVSSVIAVSIDESKITPHLRTEKNFREYLASLDIRNDSYWVGNQLAAQGPQLKNRELQLRSAKADWSLVEILEAWLYENQNPENGLWYYVDRESDSYTIYDGVNGLLKISALYNTLEIEFHYPMEAINSAIEGIYTEDTAETVCYAYNTWYSVGNIITNLLNHASDRAGAAAEVKKIRDALLDDAPNSISHTASKVATFLKDDGSFSYFPTSTSATSQGMPVALPGTNEGDVNGTVICADGTHRHMFSVLGLDVPKQYGLAERYLFLYTVGNLGPVIKDEVVIEEKRTITFNEDAIGSVPEDVTLNVKSSGSFGVIEDPRPGSNGRVFEFNSKSGGGDNIAIPCETKAKTSCYVFEGDFCVLSASGGYNAQIYIENCYMLGLKIGGDTVQIIDSSSQGAIKSEKDYGLRLKTGEWWRLKIEYYPGDEDTVRIKVYVNGELMWVCDNYYDPNGTKVTTGHGTPSFNYPAAKVLGFTENDFRVLIDNVAAYKTNDPYVSEKDPDDQPKLYNIDAPPKPELRYDFEDGRIPAGVSTSGAVEDTGNGMALSLGGSANAKFPRNSRFNKYTCTVVESDIILSSATAGASLDVSLTNGSGERIAAIRLISDGEKFKLHPLAGANAGAYLGVALDFDTQYKIRIEHFESEKIALIYINGKLVASNTKITKIAEISNVYFTKSSNSSFTVRLDNVICETGQAVFSEAIKPTGESVVHNFTTPTDYTLNGGEITNGVAMLKNGAVLLIPVNRRSAVGGYYLFTANVGLPVEIAESCYIDLRFTDGDGKTVAALRLTKDGFCELTDTKQFPSIATPDLKSAKSLSIEIYPEMNEIQLSVDGKCLLISGVTANEMASLEDTSAVEISAVGCSLSIDNAVFDSYYKEYVDKKVATNVATGLDFEDASTGDLPNGLSVDSKAGTKLAITPRYEAGVAVGKLLNFTSKAGNYDTLRYKGVVAASKRYAAVFETDIKISYEQGTGSDIDFYLIDGNGKNAYLLVLYRGGTSSNLYIRDYSNNGNVAGRVQGEEVKIGSLLDKWFRLRIEYVFGARNSIKINTYINGNLVLSSDNYYGNSTLNPTSPLTSINAISISPYTATGATVLLDNLSLREIAEGEEPPVIPDAPDAPDTPNEPEQPKINDFESLSEGDALPEQFTYAEGQTNSFGNTSFLSVINGYDSNTTKLLKLSVDNNRGACLDIGLGHTADEANAYVFEADINADSFASSYPIFYLYMKNADITNIYALEFTYIAAGDAGVFRMRDLSTGSASTSQNGASVQIADEWFKLRVEFITAEDKNDVRFRTYINGELVYVSDNYYKEGESRLNKPIGFVRLQAYSTSKFDFYLDNVGLYSEKLEPVSEPIGTRTDFEGAYTHPTKNYYLIGTPFWSYVSAEGGFFDTVTEDDSSFLRIYSNGKITSSSNRRVNLDKTAARDHGVDAFVLDTKIRVNLTTEGSFDFRVEDSSIRHYFKAEQSEGKIYIDGVYAFDADKWVSLRIQYYNNGSANMVKVTVDGNVILDKAANTGADVLGFTRICINMSQSIVGNIDLDDTYVGVDEKK